MTRAILRDNGLTIALMAIFVFCLGGMVGSGWIEENLTLQAHGAPSESLLGYVFSPSFQSALFENWESEFLQMSAYVIMTAFLFQRGSSESKDPDGDNAEDANPRKQPLHPDAPWPARAGGLVSVVYSHSLGLALLGLFFASFVMHWTQSAAASNANALLHGLPTQTTLQYLGDPHLWFESFQNWQSEFLSTAVLVVLSIVLRQRGSPESKAVSDPHAKTGH